MKRTNIITISEIVDRFYDDNHIMTNNANAYIGRIAHRLLIDNGLMARAVKLPIYYPVSIGSGKLPLYDNTRDTSEKETTLYYGITDGELHTSPEQIAWTQKSAIDKDLMRLVSQCNFSDYDKMGIYNSLRPLSNKAPLYFRDSIFSIAWEKYQAHSGSKTIIHEIRSTLWRIKHLKAYGYDTATALEHLQGMNKTNKVIGEFTAANIEELEANYDISVEHEVEYSVAQSDYNHAIGYDNETIDALNYNMKHVTLAYDIPHSALQIVGDKELYKAIAEYIMGLKVSVVNKLKDKVIHMDIMAFTATSSRAWVIYTGRFYRGFLEHYLLGKENVKWHIQHIKDTATTSPNKRIANKYKRLALDFHKRQFLTYAFIALGGIMPNYVRMANIKSIDVESGMLNGKPKNRVEIIRHNDTKTVRGKRLALLHYNSEHIGFYG
jgi:hypothetical protein